MKYTPEQLQYQSNRFFDPNFGSSSGSVDGNKISISRPRIKTLNALRIWLGIDSDDWKHYCRLSEYRTVVDEIRTKLELWLEEKLLLDNKPVGAIFALKAQHGWSDLPQNNNSTKNYIYVFGNEKSKLLDQGKKFLEENTNIKETNQPIIEMKPIKKAGRPKGSKSSDKFTRKARSRKDKDVV